MSDLEPAGARDRTDAIAHLRDTLAPAGVAPGAEQQFAIVPLSRRDSFLVPLDSRAAARRSLSEYGALRSLPKRVARQALGAAWTIGLPEVVLRGRATLPAGDETLLGHLREVLGEPALTFATGLRWVGSFYTPVLQLFRPDGTPVAYAKIGWDDVTTSQVRAESDALALVAAGATDLLHAPGLLHAGQWQHLELCVTAPLPRRSKRVPSAQLPPVLALREVAMLDGAVATHAVRRSPWWQQIVDAAPALEGQAPGLGEALDGLDADVGAVELSFGRWHGDWVAWNMAEAPGRALRLGLGVQPARSSVRFRPAALLLSGRVRRPFSAAPHRVRGRGDAGHARTVSTRARHRRAGRVAPAPPPRGPPARRERGAARCRAGSEHPVCRHLHTACTPLMFGSAP